jgi:WD40 repeat protein
MRLRAAGLIVRLPGVAIDANALWAIGVAAETLREAEEPGSLALAASRDHTLKVWGVASGRELRTLTGHTGLVNGVALSGDGRTAVSASWDKTLKVWEVASGRELRTLTGHTGSVEGVALSGDGRIAVSLIGHLLDT